MQDFTNKVAVITGGAGGIGLAIARRLAREGVRLVLADRNAESLEQTCSALRAAGSDAWGVPTDVTDPASVEALARAAQEHFGQIDILVNNAGVFTTGTLWDSSLQELQWVTDVNVWGVIHCIRTFVPLLIQQRTPAHILNVSSVAGLSTTALVDIYGISKFAVMAASETLFRNLAMTAPFIKVSVLCPGIIRTGLLKSSESTRPAAQQKAGGAQFAGALMKQAIEAGLPPERVAEVAFEAMRDERFYALAMRPQELAFVHQRLDDIRAERNPTQVSPSTPPTAS